MKVILRNVLVLITLFMLPSIVGVDVAYSQNPKQTKKRKQKSKKQKKPKDEPIEYSPNDQPDSDGDGVPNYYDHCPNTQKGETVTTFGCPPDSDKDGIFDYKDPCPEEYGPKVNNGCPYGDKDNDGLLDKNDMCPDKAGPKRFYGCPDTDGDGVPDHKDDCPTVSGLVKLKGCAKAAEDSDNDGIMNADDKCPLVAGVPENKGCPEMKKEDLDKIKEAFENLLFESGKDVIKESSYASLEKLAQVMLDNAGVDLSLEGHTDSQGDDDDNLDLSDRRAKAVKQFLVDYGVSSNRISAKGFGETQPVDSNDSASGRKHNRRVEMKIKF